MKKKTSLRDRIHATAGREAPVYQGGKSGEIALSLSLRRLLEDASLEDLSGEQLDHLERILAGALSAVAKLFIAEAFTVRLWSDRKAPGCERCSYSGSWMPGDLSAGWRDHLSRLISASTGRVYFRSEPYELSGDGLRNLVALMDQGWNVLIKPNLSDHFPGRTMAILLSKPVQEQRP